MSGVLKGIAKVFKKVVKVAKVVIPIALAAAAVVFTGGAALGILPTFAGAIGGLVGSLGISGALAGALTGSIVSAGFGGAAGFVLSGGKLSGLQKGALTGAVTGGALGLASPAMFGVGASAAQNGAINSIVDSNAAWINGGGASAAGAAGNGILPGAAVLGGQGANAGMAAPTIAAPAATAPVAAAPTVTAANTAGGNGIMNGFFSNPTNTMMAGNVLTGLFTPSEASQAAKLRAKEGDRLFSDAYSSGEANPGQADYGPGQVAVRPVKRFRFNPQTLKVEETADA